MAQIGVGDIVLMRSYCWLAAELQAGINDYWYRCTAKAGAGASDVAAVQQWSTGIAPFIKDLITDRAAYQGASANIYRAAVRPTLTVKSNNGAGAGTAAGGVIPTQVRGLLHKQSDVGGQAGRGRVYIPFPSIGSNTTEGQPEAAYLADMALLGAFADATFVATTGADSSTMIPVLVNRTTLATKAIVEWTPQPKWATQRRSGAYGRPNAPFTV